MEEEDTSLTKDVVFDAFPYQPYDIQIGFMKNLYETLEKGGIGLFESPTGTGKTMSLICASLHWLEEWQKQQEAGDEAEDADKAVDEDEPDWMRDYARNLDKERRKLHETLRSERLEKARSRLERMKDAEHGRMTTTIKLTDESDDEFLIGPQDDAENDGDSLGGLTGRKRLSSYLEGSSSSDEEVLVAASGGEEDHADRMQIFFLSRTHSQLMQFVGELKKTRFYQLMSLVSLGSRKQLCINPDVKKLNSAAMMNERCMDLQNATSKVVSDSSKKINNKKCRCPYLQRGSEAERTMIDMILAEPLDIEDLASLGKKRGVCPYYAARSASSETDIILAPYSSLIVSETRESLGLTLDNKVVVVDEAHNLIDAINASHSACLSKDDTEKAVHQIEFYFNRFKTRLASRNAKTVQTLLSSARAILKGFQDGFQGFESTVAVDCNSFLFATGLDNINMIELRRDIKENKLIFKMGGYWKKISEGENASTQQAPGSASLQSLVEFLTKLSYDNADGRIVIDKNAQSIKYIMLNASMSFKSILDQARAVVLASGTLSPLETVMPLFGGKEESTMKRFQCDHIIDPARLLALALPVGPSGKTFDFRHTTRSDASMISELGRAIINVSRVTPSGIVVFVSSFAYCDLLMREWKGDGTIETLQVLKDVYVEPRSATDVDQVLANYSESIQKAKGAIIFSIVGGKLAEGINFGDDMGRCVMMVGLPYPNPSDPELQERMKFADHSARINDCTNLDGREYYTNLCMKAVNQCIGRAIRHINDYACILLVDQRYAVALDSSKSPISTKLPGWIKKSLTSVETFGHAQARIAQFFRAMSNMPSS